MSKIVLYPANDYDFDAADVAAYLAGLTSGVFSGDEDFPVTAAGGLKVTVGAGRGWVHPSRFTGYSITKREADTLRAKTDRVARGKYDRMEQDNERLADHQRSVLCNIRDEVDALDTLLQDTRLNRRRMQGAVRIIQQMINREL